MTTQTRRPSATRWIANSGIVPLVSIMAIGMLAWLPNIGFGQSRSNPDLLLTHARIVDVESGTLTSEKQILTSRGRIIEIADEISEIKPNTVTIDLTGNVVLPGLIDLHSHLLLHPYDEATWNDQVLRESLGLRTIRGTVHAKRTLESGFTTIRDLGTEGAGFADVAIRDAIRQGIIPGPRVLTVTKALVTTGGYGPSGFDPRFTMPMGAQPADGVADVRRVTREQIAAGADWIKVYADYRRRAGHRSTPTFSLDELKAIVDEAKSAGMKVSAHATTDEGIRRAVLAGVATIEHGYQASAETLKLMRDHDVVLCPTLAASESMAMYGGWKPGTRAPSRITTARQLMKNVAASGVTVACGSDVGVFSHGTSYRELELMFAYGMPIDDVIRSATITASKVIGMENRLGIVKKGYLADLMIVENNPLEDLATLRSPILVIQNGIIVSDKR